MFYTCRNNGVLTEEWGNPITKELTWCVLTDKWILAQKLRIPKIQIAKHKKIKKEDQRMDTSLLLRIGNKIPMEGLTETKCGAETEGKTIQRLPHLGIHPNPDTIVAANKCLLAGAWYRCSLRGSTSAWQIQEMLTVVHWIEHRVPQWRS